MAHLQHGFPDPTAEAPLLSLLLKGIKRTRQSNTQQRQPVTASLLESIKPALRSLPLSSSQRTLYWAAFTLAFYAFLRVGEYTARTRLRAHRSTLRARQVQLSSSSITIRLRRSKTSQFKSPPPIQVGANHGPTCPVRALRKFLNRRKASSDQPLFVFKDGSLLTPKLVTATLKSALKQFNHSTAGFSSHSFRVGAASAASASGMSDHMIQKLGRWRSEAFKAYIKPTKQTLTSSSKAMAQRHWFCKSFKYFNHHMYCLHELISLGAQRSNHNACLLLHKVSWVLGSMLTLVPAGIFWDLGHGVHWFVIRCTAPLVTFTGGTQCTCPLMWVVVHSCLSGTAV